MKLSCLFGHKYKKHDYKFWGSRGTVLKCEICESLKRKLTPPTFIIAGITLAVFAHGYCTFFSTFNTVLSVLGTMLTILNVYLDKTCEINLFDSRL